MGPTIIIFLLQSNFTLNRLSVFLNMDAIGQYERQIRRKSFVVLGGDLKLKQQRRVEKFTSNEIQVPAYNHC